MGSTTNYPVISFVSDSEAIGGRAVPVLVKLNKAANPYTDAEVVMREH